MDRKVFSIIAQIMSIPVEIVTETSSPNSLEEWDSLNHMKLILAIEEAFGVQFTDEEIVSIRDVRSIIVLLGRKSST